MSFNIGIALGSALGGIVKSGPGFIALDPTGAVPALLSLAMTVVHLLAKRRGRTPGRRETARQ